MKLSIIIPAFNEEKTVQKIIKDVDKVRLPNGILKEIIVVDDASRDNTKKEVEALIKSRMKNLKLISHKVNTGKGGAVKTGFKNANGEIILVQDADLEYNPEDIPRLLEPIIKGKADVVYGTRLRNYPLRIAGKRKTPLITHYLGNKFLSLFTNLLYKSAVTDMETGYKVLKKSVLEKLDLKAKRFDFEPEITAKILKKGIKIYEVPIKVTPRGYEEGKKITWKDGINALTTLIKYKFKD